MKLIIINTPDGQYSLPLIKVAEHRASHYSISGYSHVKVKQEIEFAMNNDFECIDWLLKNSNYEDWENETTKINSDAKVTLEDFWSNSDDFEIVEVDEVDDIQIQFEDDFFSAPPTKPDFESINDAINTINAYVGAAFIQDRKLTSYEHGEVINATMYLSIREL